MTVLRVVGVSTNLRSWLSPRLGGRSDLDEAFTVEPHPLDDNLWRNLGLHSPLTAVFAARLRDRELPELALDYFDIGLFSAEQLPVGRPVWRRVRRIAPYADPVGPNRLLSDYAGAIGRVVEYWQPEVVAIHVGLAFEQDGDSICSALLALGIGAKGSDMRLVFEGRSSFQRDLVLSCPATSNLVFNWVGDYRSPREIVWSFRGRPMSMPNELSPTTLARGLAAAPGVVAGYVFRDGHEAISASKQGKPVVLVLDSWSDEIAEAVSLAVGLIVKHGGMASHAAAAARAVGIPAVLGIKNLRLADDGFSIGGISVGVGEIIEVDGFDGEIRQ